MVLRSSTCLRLWMDGRGGQGISKNDLQCYCAVLAKAYPFARSLNSQARQASADRAWCAISRFYDNCKSHKPGKKGYPRFQHDNRSSEYKTTGWKVEPDGKHITFNDGSTVDNPRNSRKPEQKLKRLHARVSRKQKKSKNRKKARRQLAREYLKVQRHREDFARKTASTLISSHDVIAFEDVQIRTMVRNHHLAKSIHDGWMGHVHLLGESLWIDARCSYHCSRTTVHEPGV